MSTDLKLRSSKVAIVSDIHGGVHRNSQSWYTILMDWCGWFKQECIDNDIKDIIIPGDIFHHRHEVNVHTMNIVYDMFKMLECFNVIVTIGNHDAYYKNTSEIHSLVFLKDWENVSIIDTTTTITAFDSVITFCPWGVDMDKVPQSDIIFGHFELKGFNMAAHKICAHGLPAGNVLEKAPLVFTGHFHLRDERTYQTGTIIYVGSAYEQTWGDAGSTKGYYTLDINTKEYQFTRNNISPKHVKVHLSNILKHGVSDKDKKDFKSNWIKLVIDVKISPDNIDVLVTKLNTLQPLSLHIEYQCESVIDVDTDYEFKGVDIGDCIHEYIDLLAIDNKKDVSDRMLDLYRRVG